MVKRKYSKQQDFGTTQCRDCYCTAEVMCLDCMQGICNSCKKKHKSKCKSQSDKIRIENLKMTKEKVFGEDWQQ